jgi:ribosomal protein L11 methyltransferase
MPQTDMSKRPLPRKSRTKGSQKTENWLEITAKGPPRGKDIASQILIDTGSPGVLDLSKGPVSVLKAHLRVEEKDKVHSIEKKLKKFDWKVTSYPCAGGDWTEKWKRWIRPVNVCGVFLVKPSWRRVAEDGRVVIEIDPGMAFGTGTHPSTKLCLKAMANVLGRKATACTVLDVGTGTGILAIAAKKLGVKRALGVDTDPVALKVARKNARLNDVKVELTRKPVGELKGSFNLIVSNIVSGELVKLASLLAKRVREGGFIIFSGILKEELRDVVSAYMRLGLRHFKTYTEGGWVCPVFERRA